MRKERNRKVSWTETPLAKPGLQEKMVSEKGHLVKIGRGTCELMETSVNAKLIRRNRAIDTPAHASVTLAP